MYDSIKRLESKQKFWRQSKNTSFIHNDALGWVVVCVVDGAFGFVHIDWG